uniref:Endothelial cell adhesion molecule a n=1 Tax=Iconisemion striatum TaxID=60296 RepID=A0A1A7YX82_9TELE
MKVQSRATLLLLMWKLSGELVQTSVINMEAIQGQRVVLKASYNPDPLSDLNTNTIIWNYIKNTTQPIISYTKGSIIVGSTQFSGRVGFVATMPAQDLSLYINNTGESDSGYFSCQVITPNNLQPPTEFNLDVKVPPAVPKCSLFGKPVLKGNVTLTCTSVAGKPLPLYKWKKTSPTSEVFFSPMLNEKAGTLKLSNLSSNMSGKYECTASNTAGSETCFINLEVVNSNKLGMTVGAAVGSVLGFIFILAICIGFLFFFKRRRENEDDIANDIKEDAQAPKRVSWAKRGLGSDLISKNGTLSSIASSPHFTSSHHHHQHHLQQYPQHPTSDTASIITATGSTAGYRPTPLQGASTHYSSNNSSTLPAGQQVSSMPTNNRSPIPLQEHYGQLPQAQALPQTYSQLPGQLQSTPSPPPLPTFTFTASNISRMGGVPIMVPAQNQAGSLV